MASRRVLSLLLTNCSQQRRSVVTSDMRKCMKDMGAVRRAVHIKANLINEEPMFANSQMASEVFKLGKLNHVAIATPDLEQTAGFYRNVLKAHVSEGHDQPEHGVRTVFVELGDAKLELLLPIGDNSPITNFLDKNKSGGLHHICIEVENLPEALKSVKAAGIRQLGKEPKIGAHGKPVMFLHPKDCNGILIELEEA